MLSLCKLCRSAYAAAGRHGLWFRQTVWTCWRHDKTADTNHSILQYELLKKIPWVVGRPRFIKPTILWFAFPFEILEFFSSKTIWLASWDVYNGWSKFLCLSRQLQLVEWAPLIGFLVPLFYKIDKFGLWGSFYI